MKNTQAIPVYDTTPEGRLAVAKRLWDWEPHPGQREFLTLRLADGQEPGTLVAVCGRRWGKTEALGCDIAVRILTEPDLGQLGVAPTRDQAECLFDSVEEKIRGLIDDPENFDAFLAEFPVLGELEFKRTPYPMVRNTRTRQMVFWVRAAGRRGRNLRGRGTTRRLKRFRVIVDERAFVEDEAVESAIKPMLATMPGGGQLVEISSPYRKRGGFYEDFVRGEEHFGRYRSVRLPSSQNPRVDPVWLAEQRETMTDAAFRTEFLAEFLDTAGAVFPEGDIAPAIVADDYGRAPLWGCRYVAGLDLARRGDYTVLTVLEVGLDRLRVVELYRVQGLGYGDQVARVTEALKRWGVCRIAADATGAGDPVCELLANSIAGERLRCALDDFVFTMPSKAALIDRLILALSRRTLVFPPHPPLLSELRNFEATPTGAGHERLEAAGAGHDDCVCSLALAVYAAAPIFAAGSGARVGEAIVSRGAARVIGQKGKDDGWEFSQAHPHSLAGRISDGAARTQAGLPGRVSDEQAQAAAGTREDGSLAVGSEASSNGFAGYLPDSGEAGCLRSDARPRRGFSRTRAIRTRAWRLLMHAYRFAPVRRAGAFLASSMRSMRSFIRRAG